MQFGTAAINKVPEYTRNFEQILAAAPAMVVVELVPEPTNPYDNRAVKVNLRYQDTNGQQRSTQVGYIKKSDQDVLLSEYGPGFFTNVNYAKVTEWGRFPTSEGPEALFLNFEVV